jgi:hypothetical protein
VLAARGGGACSTADAEPDTRPPAPPTAHSLGIAAGRPRHPGSQACEACPDDQPAIVRSTAQHNAMRRGGRGAATLSTAMNSNALNVVAIIVACLVFVAPLPAITCLI